ncbi:DUF4238 domain-containing protein [Embleya sp. MST-111070]|uniref:DUF4238 domain-containing protein n=1 Tax=Embleya sp. MST-111070 TaxID=3398231 RepID=UPI003F7338DD
MTANDHTVPQMYLRRFAEQRRNRGHFTIARNAEDPSVCFPTNVRNVAAVKGFYWGTAPDGTLHHEAERGLCRIEAGAAGVFSMILDDAEYALPRRWPLRPADRRRMSWWIAAQLLRTTRQRKRLDHLKAASGGGTLDAPPNIRSAADNDDHLRFIEEYLGPLAFLVDQRPWGVGVSAACLMSGDVPVVVLNGQDSDDQMLSAAHLSILVPLDPHRFLFLPDLVMQQEDRNKRVDHRLKLDGGIGLIFSVAIHDAADIHLFQHPAHNPMRHLKLTGPRLPTPWVAGGDHPSPSYAVAYDVMAPDLTVDRRFVREHDDDRSHT